MDKICHIVGAAVVRTLNLKKNDGDIVIAADGGKLTLDKFNITADYFVGDVDSGRVPDDIPKEKTLILSPIKDVTDTMRAAELAISLGYKSIRIYGGTGGRTSHTIANIQMISELCDREIHCEIVSENEIITMLKNGKMRFDKSSVGYISVFSLDETAQGVSEIGLKYMLDNYTMSNTYPVGVSNEFTGKRAEISVENGKLLVIYSDNAVVMN